MNKSTVLSMAIIIMVSLTRFASLSYCAAPEDIDKKYSDKSRVILLYDESIKVSGDWSYITDVHKKVKILKDSAKDHGEISISYDSAREKILSLEAFTIAPDGTRYPASKTQEINVYDGYPMYSDSMVKVITMPAVTVGSIIEYRVTIASKGLPIEKSFWWEGSFDSSQPIEELRFSITMPKSLKIKYKEFGLTSKPRISRTDTDITYSWIMTDIDADQEDEEFVPLTTPDTVKECVEFSSIVSWDDLSRWYLGLIKKNMKITPEIKRAVDGVVKGKATVRDKTRAVLEYMQKNFRYVSMSFGDNVREPHPTDEVFKNKYGDCKDLSLLCKAMLEAAGIESHICLFNTEADITDPQYSLPMPSLFNHALLSVHDPDEGDFFADPLLEGYDIGQYPLAYQMAYAFIIKETGGEFARFPEFGEDRNYTSYKSTVQIEKDGSALIETDNVWDLDFSIDNRDVMKRLSSDKRKKLYDELAGYLTSGGQMIEMELNGLDQGYGAVKTHKKMKLYNKYPITDGILVIDIAGYERGYDFMKKERSNPVFYPYNSLKEDVTIYRLPEGYEVSHLPADLDLDNGFLSIKRTYKRLDDGIQVAQTVRFKRVQIPREEYSKIKDFYGSLISKTWQRIIAREAVIAQ